MQNSVVIIEEIRAFESVLQDRTYSPAFPERSHIFRDLLREGGESVGLRSIAAPTYLTDLGIRRIDDPKEFYLEHCRIAGCEPIADARLVAFAQEFSSVKLMDFFDAIVLFFGAYEAAAEVIALRRDEILDSDNYALLTAVGTVLSATGQFDATLLFERARQVAETISDEYLATHRLAATLIKRQGNPAKGVELLGQYARLADANMLSQGSLGLLLNLEALGKLRMNGDLSEAFDLLCRADSTFDQELSESNITDGAYSRICRYKSQVAINKAQLLVKMGDYDKAFEVMVADFNFCCSRASDYAGEAAGSLALTAFKVSRLADARTYSDIAMNESSKHGALLALRTARKIHVASLWRSGERDRAAMFLEGAKNDPLGVNPKYLGDL